VANSLFIVKVFVAALTSVMFALLSQRAVAQSSERAQMAPASPWSIDYAQDSCALRRSFAAGSNQMFLELRQFGPSASFEVTVASSTFRPSSSVRTRFEPDDAFFVPHDGVLVSGGNLNAVRYTDDFIGGEWRLRRVSRSVRDCRWVLIETRALHSKQAASGGPLMKFVSLKSRGGNYLVVASNIAWLRSAENGQTNVGIVGSTPLLVVGTVEEVAETILSAA